ncbi:MAG: hypothetical protein LBJ92_03685 [Holosporales bacterium]|nr:hypothetical protein [Holosporales bacterium]
MHYPLLEGQMYTDDIRELEVRLHDGDMLNFAAAGIQGNVIRFASELNDIPNPLGLAHSGLVVVATPREISGVIDYLSNPANYDLDYRPQPEALMLMRESLRGYHSNTLIPFCLEASGTAGQVLQGINPHVQITPLEQVIRDYDGNVYVRQLRVQVPHCKMIDFIKCNLVRPYEGLNSFTELAKSTLKLNQTEDTRKVFCSELAALFYRQAIGLNIKCVSDVIPEEFGSGAGIHDILRGKAGAEIALKQKFVYHDEDPDQNCCPCLLL